MRTIDRDAKSSKSPHETHDSRSSFENGHSLKRANVSPVEVSDRSNSVVRDLLDKGQGAPGPVGNPTGGTAEPAPNPLLRLFNEAAEQRPRYTDAEEQHDRITWHLLTVAYRMTRIADKDDSAKAAIRDEARRLGARPNSRSEIEHLAVDIAFGPKTSLRTRHAQAVRGGIALDLTPEEFEKEAAKGSSGKGGIKALAKIGREKRAANGSPPASTHANPVPEPHLNGDRRVPLREHGYLSEALLSEEVQKTLRASDLKTSDEFRLLVRITPNNGLEGVRYLGAHRPSNRGGPAQGR